MNVPRCKRFMRAVNHDPVVFGICSTWITNSCAITERLKLAIPLAEERANS